MPPHFYPFHRVWHILAGHLHSCNRVTLISLLLIRVRYRVLYCTCIPYPMAYQEYQESSYPYPPPRNTYAGPTNNAAHFPQSHQQHSLFYPNAVTSTPIPIPYPHSSQSNDPSPPPPSYTHPQPSQGQTYQAQRFSYPPNQNHNTRAPLMQSPMTVPHDHFKKPYLPQQQYMSHGPLLSPM